MPKYMAVHVVILAGLVLAVTFLVFQSRALTIKVERLEAARARSESAPLRGGPDPEAKRITHHGADYELDEPKPAVEEGSPRIRVNPAPTPTPTTAPASEPSTETTLTPAQEQAVAKAVERILKEKYGHIPKPMKPEEFEKMLDQELKLSESQKVRIGEILKWKREELNKLFEGQDPMAGGTMKKAMDLERKAEAAIKNELDATQQAKYDQLKKDGKIPQGVMIQVEAGGKDGE